MLIRRAGPADLDELLTVVAEFYALDGHRYDRGRVLRGLGPLLTDDRLGQVWLVDAPGAGTAAYAVVTWGWSLESGGRDCILDELYVRERGTGLGARVLREVVAAATDAGASTMFLETEAHNARARRFYTRLGFATEDSVWMRLPLAGGPVS